MQIQQLARISGLVFVAVIIQAGGRFSDNAGNMVIENWTSWKATRVGEKGLKFVGSGKPVRGSWKDQGLNVTALKIDGDAVLGKGDAFQLTTATISGDVHAEIKRAGSDGATNTIELDTSSIDFIYSQSKAVLKGSVHVEGVWGKDKQTFSLDAPSAVITLPPAGKKADFPIRTADVPGRVTMKFGGTRIAKDPKTGKAQAVQFGVIGKADHLYFDDDARTIRLVGNVHLTGSDPTVGGEMDAASAIIHLTADRKVKEIELTGTPGKSTLRGLGSGGGKN